MSKITLPPPPKTLPEDRWFQILYKLLMGLTGGLTIIIITTKLTAGGVNGSMTFTNGVLTAQTAAT